jgi:hypothetical protein
LLACQGPLLHALARRFHAAQLSQAC